MIARVSNDQVFNYLKFKLVFKSNLDLPLMELLLLHTLVKLVSLMWIAISLF